MAQEVENVKRKANNCGEGRKRLQGQILGDHETGKKSGFLYKKGVARRGFSLYYSFYAAGVAQW